MYIWLRSGENLLMAFWSDSVDWFDASEGQRLTQQTIVTQFRSFASRKVSRRLAWALAASSWRSPVILMLDRDVIISRALYKSHRVRTGRPDQSFWQRNGLFPRVFAEKPSPSCILFRIWLIWLNNFHLIKSEIPTTKGRTWQRPNRRHTLIETHKMVEKMLFYNQIPIL